MGNPSSGCTNQAPMSLAKRRHRQSLSLQLEQLAHPGCINGEKKKSASAVSSPKTMEENSLVSFLGGKQVARRKPSSLSGAEDYLKGIELTGGGGTQASSTEDRKPISFNPFRGHRRVGSGTNISSCKSLESTPREKGTSSSFRKDKYAVAKIAASLFHSPAKLERSMSMSRVCHKAMPEEVVSLRQKFQLSSDDGSQSTDLDAGKENGFETLVKDLEESTRPLISNASSLKHYDNGITKTSKGETEPEIFATTAIEDPPSSTGDISGLPSVHHVLEYTPSKSTEESVSNLLPAGMLNDELHTEQSPCTIELNPYGWKIKSSQSLPSSSEKCSSLEAKNVSESCADVSKLATEEACVGSRSSRHPCGSSETSNLVSIGRLSLGSFHSERISLPPEAVFTEETAVDEKIAVEESIISLIFATEKVTEEELTEAAVLSSLNSEEYLTSTVIIPSTTSIGETHAQGLSPGMGGEKSQQIESTTCKAEACLTKSVSFEPGVRNKAKVDSDRKSKLRKRRRSVSASGIGAMLLKVVRVSDSGPMITRRLPKVGPEMISGVDALRAREYVLQKTAQISMGRAYESFSPSSAAAAAAAAVCQCESEHAVKSTYSKFVDIELDSGGDCVELVQHSKESHEGDDGTGSGAASNCETRQQNQQSTSERLREMIPTHLSDHVTSSESTCPPEVGSSLHERVERVNSNLQRHAADGKFDGRTKSARFRASGNISAADSAVNVDERSGKPRKKSSRKNSIDFDSLTECLKTANPNTEFGQAHPTTNKEALSIMDANVAISRERSRSFVSRLQAPSGISSVDVFHLAPSSISILANPSFSSSHQDRLWEEQAEAYSSGGRGTPGREDEVPGAAPAPAPAPAANVFLHSPSPPGGAISSDDHQVASASGSLRRGLFDSSTAGTASTVREEKGRHKWKGQGKKRGRPHTPLRSLLADDVHSKRSGARSPESRHFIQQIMSRIRRSSSKSVSPKSSDAMSKRRNTWSSCICFSIK